VVFYDIYYNFSSLGGKTTILKYFWPKTVTFNFITDVPTIDHFKKSRIRYAGSSDIIGPLENGKPFLYVGSCDLACIHGPSYRKNSGVKHSIKNTESSVIDFKILRVEKCNYM